MRNRALSSLLNSLSLLLLGVGCGEDAAAPMAARIAAMAGDNQEASVCALASTAPSVRIDRAGIPQAGISVTFTVTGGGGAVTGEHAVTDAAGLATVGSWTLGSDTGMNRLTATAENVGSVEFTAMGHAEQVLRNVIIFTTSQPGHTADVAVVRPDGSCRRQLTHGGGAYAAPAISPDGKSIAVAHYDGGWRGIYIMNADGSGLTKLVGDSYFNMAPVWSPDGAWLAFERWTQDPPNVRGAIYVIKVDGTGLRRVTPESSAPGADPSWSPDGTKIAYGGLQGLHVINVDGTGDIAVPNGGQHAAWSPDGSRFANDGLRSINVVNVDGSNAHPIVSVPDTVQVDGPMWSPDSRWLVFERVDVPTSPPPPPTTPRPQLFIVGADGGSLHILSDSTGQDGWAKWSPL